MIYQIADPGITEEEAAQFVAEITGHLPPDYTARTAIRWPLTVGADPKHAGVPGMLLDGYGAMWTLPAGDDSAEHYQPAEGGGVVVTKYRNGNKIETGHFS